MAPLKNTFSWSSSREKVFRSCPRKYYWHYYGSWEGWREVASRTARLAYRLKHLTTLPMWAGEIVHGVVESALRAARSGMRPTVEETREEARRRLNQGWAQSVGRQWRRDPKRVTNLFEHYYGEGVTKEQRVELREHVFACIGHCFESAAFKLLRAEGPERWLALEELDSFELAGAPVWVKLDAACRSRIESNGGAQDGVTIIDWKTGAARDADGEQLGTYALYAMGRWKTPPDRIAARLVYLRDGTEETLRPDPAALIEHREAIRASMERMRAALADRENNVAALESFPPIDDPGACVRCQFKQLCERM